MQIHFPLKEMGRSGLKALFKAIVPVGLRTRIKWAGYALRDFVDPISQPRVPSRRETFIGGGNFVGVGDHFLKTLIRHGLQPDMSVLDIGCGQGRMARPLVEYLSRNGSYTGLDIVASGIDWCQREYADLENFTFLHADVHNKNYNPGGSVLAKDYRLPFETDSFDLIFLTSVFTHMFAEDMENYLAEISRVLKPGGKALITWFLLNDQSRGATQPALDFRYELDEVSRTTLRESPEAAIAFDEAHILSLYQRYGLSIDAIEHGRWAWPDSQFDLQDMIIAVKQ